MASLVQSFFSKFKVAKKDRQGRQYTHTFISGGSFIVPNDESVQDKLFSAIVADLRAGRPMFINEIASNVFKMYLDFDILHHELLTEDEVSELSMHVFTVFRRFFPDNIMLTQPNFYMAFVTESSPQLLCANREDLQNLTTPSHHYTVDNWINIMNGNVKIEGRTGGHSIVDWSGPVPPDGVYDIKVDDDRVLLVAHPSSSFQNPLRYHEELERALRSGPIPPDAKVVSQEVQTVGDWTGIDGKTIFVLDDGRHFMNAKRNADGMLKHGIHLIFPDMRVDIESALTMREALLDHLTVKLGTKFAPNGFADVVDHAVYGNGKGLRMYGSHKASDCVCKRTNQVKREDDPETCMLCRNGKIDEKRPHVLRSIYANGIRNPELEMLYRQTQHLEKLVRETSIRTWRPPVNGWSRYVGCPQIGDMIKRTTDKDGNIDTKIINDGRPVMHETKMIKRLKTDAKTQDVTDQRIHEIFQRNIRRWTVYNQLRVSNVKHVSKKDGFGATSFYFISVEGEGQHLCLNKHPAGEHKSSVIYFQATNTGKKKGISVRCRCPKTTTEGRMQGPCPEYYSTPKPMSTQDNAILFPTSSGSGMSSNEFAALPFDVATKMTSCAFQN